MVLVHHQKIKISWINGLRGFDCVKYTILGFQQEKLIESKLSIEDAFILRTIKDLYSSATMEFITIDNDRLMWVNYSYLLEQIPIVGSKRNLMRRIESYSNNFLIVRMLKKQRNGVRGNFSYIAPTEKLDRLQDFDLMTKSHKGYDKIAQGLGHNGIRVMTKSHNKDTSISDTSISDTKYICKTLRFTPPTILEIEEYCKDKSYSTIDPERFFNFYESKGWLVGKAKMKNWHAALSNWNKGGSNGTYQKFTGQPTTTINAGRNNKDEYPEESLPEFLQD